VTWALFGLLFKDVCERALTHGRRFSGAGCTGLRAHEDDLVMVGGEGVREDGVPLRVASMAAS